MYFVVCFVFFFFKQKTAYEMRISDWSSDVSLPIYVRAADAKAPGGDRRQGALTLRHPVGIRQPLEAVARQCVDAGDLAGDLDQAPYLRVVGLPGENELPGHQAVTIRPARNDGTFKRLTHRLEGRQRLHRQDHR